QPNRPRPKPAGRAPRRAPRPCLFDSPLRLAAARPPGVAHIPPLEVPARRAARLPIRAVPVLVAFRLDGRPALAPDRARHSPAELEMLVCRVDDSIRVLLGDVTLHERQRPPVDQRLHVPLPPPTGSSTPASCRR